MATVTKVSPRFIPTNRLEQYDLINKKGQDLGQVQNFVVDMVAGRIALVIVAFGGMLGISDKWFAMPWELMTWSPEHKKFILDMEQKVLETAPGLHKATWMEDINAEWVDRVYLHYGLASYLTAGKMTVKTDKEIQQDVMDEIKWEPIVHAAAIGVIVTDGVVKLSGYVDSYYEKWAAERAAARVLGVKAVQDALMVKLPDSLKRPDQDVARVVSDALEWNISVPKNRVKAQVRDGVVTLSGEVDWWYQKDAAEDVVRKLIGVVSVNNQITIKPTVKLGDVKNKIEDAFRRNALLDSKRIKVETSGGKVILTGNVSNWAEREQVERAAWATPGVLEVESHIMLKPWPNN